MVYTAVLRFKFGYCDEFVTDLLMCLGNGVLACQRYCSQGLEIQEHLFGEWQSDHH